MCHQRMATSLFFRQWYHFKISISTEDTAIWWLQKEQRSSSVIRSLALSYHGMYLFACVLYRLKAAPPYLLSIY